MYKILSIGYTENRKISSTGAKPKNRQQNTTYLILIRKNHFP